MDQKMAVAAIFSRANRRVHIEGNIVLTIRIEFANGEIVSWLTAFFSGGDTLLSNSLEGVIEIVT
ncbi:hypothetical protein SAMN05216277_103262 [Halolamina pelagica]|uniref:Uncharacterized protein n=1 Tax=Halolamina pelagica TaxID=699431 RepID=A0A1I5Q5I8_9EURY|nr:hypothetical protein SAMN05216277_103262 [Halolamina pelagica]